eukprot:gene10001-biopygen10642
MTHPGSVIAALPQARHLLAGDGLVAPRDDLPVDVGERHAPVREPALRVAVQVRDPQRLREINAENESAALCRDVDEVGEVLDVVLAVVREGGARREVAGGDVGPVVDPGAVPVGERGDPVLAYRGVKVEEAVAHRRAGRAPAQQESASLHFTTSHNVLLSRCPSFYSDRMGKLRTPTA